MTDIILKNNPNQQIQNAIFNGKAYSCIVGRSGIRNFHAEGDGATPSGKFKIKNLFFRSDKIPQIKCILPKFEIQENDLWCDSPTNIHYNSHIKAPFSASCEQLFRSDDVYDLILVTSHNSSPSLPYLGSAIFIHIKRPDNSPTEGCVAFEKEDLIEIIENLTLNSHLIVT